MADRARTDDHARHDPMLVAAASDQPGGLAPAFAACGSCATLHHELRLVAAAVPSAWIPTRPRDFRLQPGDAARLRSRTGIGRSLRAFADGRQAITRPIALGLTSLGIVGMLLGSVPTMVPGGLAATAASAAPGMDAAGSSAGPVGIEAVPLTTDPDVRSGAALPSGGFRQDKDGDAVAPATPPARPLLILSLLFLGSGLGLLGLRMLAGPVREVR